jgi:hypothetical protein
VPYGTVSRLDAFQAINCLATIIQSLRDKGWQSASGQKLRDTCPQNRSHPRRKIGVLE